MIDLSVYGVIADQLSTIGIAWIGLVLIASLVYYEVN